MEGMGLVPLHDFYGKEIVDEKNWSILEPYLSQRRSLAHCKYSNNPQPPRHCDLMENFSLSI